MTPTATEAISTAASQIGRYYPGDSPYGVWYGDTVNSSVYDNAQFCAMGLSWAFAQHSGGLNIFPLHAYTPSGVSWFKSKGQWHNGISGIRRGDVVYFDFPGLPNRVSHVGIVESVNADGSVNTIEFNTSGTANGDQRNGRVVARKRRKSYIVGYGRPAYGQGSPPTTPGYDNGAYSVDYIRARQTQLKALGYYKGDLDGLRGPETISATKSFQRANGLVDDGWPGPKTEAVLDRLTTKIDVRDLQAAVGAVQDNVWGPDTDKRFDAVREASTWGGHDFPWGVKYAQSVVGTKVDGDWGKNSNAAHDNTVEKIQRALKALGYDPGVIDKRWGPSTEAAYQAARSAARL